MLNRREKDNEVVGQVLRFGNARSQDGAAKIVQNRDDIDRLVFAKSMFFDVAQVDAPNVMTIRRSVRMRPRLMCLAPGHLEIRYKLRFSAKILPQVLGLR